MIPPGIPDFFSRRRFVEPGDVTLSGRAWSGHAPVERVEVAVDGEWAEAELGGGVGEFAWRAWSCRMERDTRRSQPRLPRD